MFHHLKCYARYTVNNVVNQVAFLRTSREFPEEIKDSVGYTLHKIQEGQTPKNVKPLIGLKPAVFEIVSSYNTNTYRLAYTVKISEVVYVLHCFLKKSKKGIATPKKEMNLIKQRLRDIFIIEQTKRLLS